MATILLGFHLTWKSGLSSRLLQQSAASAPYLARGVAPLGHAHSYRSCLQLPRSCTVAATREATNAGNYSAYFTAQPSLGCIMRAQSVGAVIMRMKLKPHYATDARPHKMHHNRQMACLIEPREAVSRCWSCPPKLHHRALCSGQRKRQSMPLPLCPPLSSVCC